MLFIREAYNLKFQTVHLYFNKYTHSCNIDAIKWFKRGVYEFFLKNIPIHAVRKYL